MAITYVGAGTVITDTGTSITLNKNASMIDTDIMVVHIGVDLSQTQIAITPPSGWTTVINSSSGHDQPNIMRDAMYWSLGSNTNLTWTKEAGYHIGYITTYRGVDDTTPIDVAASGKYNTSASASVTATGITTVADGAWLIYTGGSGNINTSSAWYSGTPFKASVNIPSKTDIHHIALPPGIKWVKYGMSVKLSVSWPVEWITKKFYFQL